MKAIAKTASRHSSTAPICITQSFHASYTFDPPDPTAVQMAGRYVAQNRALPRADRSRSDWSWTLRRPDGASLRQANRVRGRSSGSLTTKRIRVQVKAITDTGFFVALLNRRDRFHPWAVDAKHFRICRRNKREVVPFLAPPGLRKPNR